MEVYYEFTKKVLLSLGIDVDKRSVHSSWMNVLQYSSLFLIFMCTAHTFIYFLFDEANDYFSVASIATAMFSLQSFVKHLIIIRNKDKLRDITNRLGMLYTSLDSNEQKKSYNAMWRVRNICFYVFIMEMLCIWVFNLLPFILMFYGLFTKGKIIRSFPYAFWWPFDAFADPYYYATLVYQIYVGHILMAVQIIMDQYFVLIVVDVAIHFDRLGEEVKQTIDSFEETSYARTKKRLGTCISKQNLLIEIMDELNEIYGFALLAQIVSASLIICFVGYIIMNKELFYAIPSSFGMINSLAQIFLPCWAGEIIKSSSTKVADQVFTSEFYKFDGTLKRDLILIIQASQKAKHVRASKFFVLELTGYTMIVRTAFSYLAVVRRFFKD